MKTLKEQILEHDIISFDMFNTLVLRIVSNEDAIFDLIEKKFKIKNFKKIRKESQAKCGLELQQKKDYSHANIDEIYEYIKVNENILNVEEIMEYEKKLEYDSILCNNEMMDIYKFAKKNKKRIIVTSDMYLDYRFIEDVLVKCGYTGIDKIYLSSEYRKAKFDGRLYDEVIKEEDVEPNTILHIGDNLKDDVEISKEKGFDSYYYDNKSDKTNDICESINNGIVKYIEKSEGNFWIKLGSKAGLLYQAIINNLENKGYDTIYFLSRDGYNLFNIFKEYVKNIDAKYVYTSRRALLLASITKIDDESVSSLPPFTLGQSIKEILEYIEMSNIFTKKDLESIGFTSFNDRINKLEDIDKFKKLYFLKEKEVLEVCANERKYALKYFDSLGIFNNKKVLFFDCGWNGSSQYLLENFFKSCNKNVDSKFYYAGIFDNAKSKKQLLNRKHEAYLFDFDKNQDYVNRISSSIVLLELFFGAPENSILKYDKNGYVFDNFENNLKYKKLILEGISKYISISYDYFKNIDLDIKPIDSLAPLLDLIENPTLEEAVNIGNIENVDSFAKQKGLKKYIAKVSYEDLKENPNLEIYWPYGLLKREDIETKVKKYVSKKYNIKIKSNKFKIKYYINGIKNPAVTISTICSGKVDVKVFEDSEEKKKNITYNKNTNEQIVLASLDKNISVINVQVSYDNKTINKKLYNFKIRRVYQKVFGKICRILNKFLNKIKMAWIKYHFIIPLSVWKVYIKRIFRIENKSAVIDPNNQKEYLKWLKKNEEKTIYKKLDYTPLISFVIPVYNVSSKLLTKCLKSILNQKYENIEICIADDCSTNKKTINTLKKFEKKYNNIKVVYRKSNGHISEASNSALELVSGKYVAMMDNDDVIPENAIYEMVLALNKDKTIDMIYTDEDKLDYNGLRCDPHFKSDYAPDTLLSVNYFCHFTLLRTSILKKIGGWKKGYEGSQDHDLFLRFTENASNIYHLPKILYHWRKIPGSTSIGLNQKNYAVINGKKAVEDSLKRRKVDGIVHIDSKTPYYYIEYTYKKEPLVSIIIPTKDYAKTLSDCLKSIYEKTVYKNFEVIVIDNNSIKPETFKLFDEYKNKYSNFKVIKADMEFNYSKINNLAIKEARGEYILLLNNDTEVITPEWINYMVGYAMQNHIGAVGSKLIYPDNTIQHGGVMLGMGGVAGHAFVNEDRNSIGTFGRLSVPYNYSAVTAACLMVKKSKYIEVGGLTEELTVAYNDVDFCLKLVNKGYYNVFLPMVELYHFESKSRGQEDTVEKKNRFKKESDYMYKKWKSMIKNDVMYNKNLSRIQVFKLDRKR